MDNGTEIIKGLERQDVKDAFVNKNMEVYESDPKSVLGRMFDLFDQLENVKLELADLKASSAKVTLALASREDLPAGQEPVFVVGPNLTIVRVAIHGLAIDGVQGETTIVPVRFVRSQRTGSVSSVFLRDGYKRGVYDASGFTCPKCKAITPKEDKSREELRNMTRSTAHGSLARGLRSFTRPENIAPLLEEAGYTEAASYVSSGSAGQQRAASEQLA